MAFGPVTMPMTKIRYAEIPCGEKLLKGNKNTYGLVARCVEVLAEVTNPKPDKLIRSGLFGRINDKLAKTSVLANAYDGASDVGQFDLIEIIPPVTSDIRFVV